MDEECGFEKDDHRRGWLVQRAYAIFVLDQFPSRAHCGGKSCHFPHAMIFPAARALANVTGCTHATPVAHLVRDVMAFDLNVREPENGHLKALRLDCTWVVRGRSKAIREN
jgi:hypothetical protein